LSVNKDKIVKAVDAAKKNSRKRKFTQSVELVLALRDIDIKKPENRINEIIELPYPPSREVKVAVFATGDLAVRARNAGANEVYGKETLNDLVNDKKKARSLVRGVDFFIAETSLMPLIGRVLGSILGPRGGMPTPIPPTAPIDTLINRRRRTVQLRVRSQLSAQCKVGSEDMDSEDIANNIQAVLTLLERRLERGFRNIREAYVKTTMGPPTKIAL
jgi:large subunit ribosomal protein L1